MNKTFLFIRSSLYSHYLMLSYLSCSLGNPLVSSSTDGPSTENTSGFVLLWSRERENRYYSMINCETGVFYTHEQKCPGHRVLCMTRVDNRTWLGTEVSQIHNLERKSDVLRFKLRADSAIFATDLFMLITIQYLLLSPRGFPELIYNLSLHNIWT